MLKKSKHRSMSRSAFSLIEVLIAVAILGTFVVVLVGSFGTASHSVMLNDTRQTAKNLAETQMEYIKKAPYSFAYTPPAPADPGYASTVNVATLPGKGANIQKVTITITHGGDPQYTLEGYKTN